jgi:hypothetical protein
VHIGFWWGDLRKRNHFEDIGIDEGNNIKTNLKEVGWRHGLD